MRVGFLGAGTMGAPMIQHLRERGHRVTVFVRDAGRARAFAAAGCAAAASPADAAADADAIISCVTDDDASRDVWLGASGAVGAARPGALAIEMSTLSVAYVDQWASAMASAGLEPCDAPVTGSRAGAEAGTLTCFLGAGPDASERARAVLESFCSEIVPFGPPGSGMRFKLAYNVVGGAIVTALAEGLALGEALGLPPGRCLDVFAAAGWTAPVARAKGEVMLTGEYTPAAFKAELMEKDLGYAMAAAETVRISPTMGSAARDAYRRALENGARELDFAAVRLAFDDGG